MRCVIGVLSATFCYCKQNWALSLVSNFKAWGWSNYSQYWFSQNSTQVVSFQENLSTIHRMTPHSLRMMRTRKSGQTTFLPGTQIFLRFTSSWFNSYFLQGLIRFIFGWSPTFLAWPILCAGWSGNSLWADPGSQLPGHQGAPWRHLQDSGQHDQG